MFKMASFGLLGSAGCVLFGMYLFMEAKLACFNNFLLAFDFQCLKRVFQPAELTLYSESLPLWPHSSVHNRKLRVILCLSSECQNPEVWCCVERWTHNGAVILQWLYYPVFTHAIICPSVRSDQAVVRVPCSLPAHRMTKKQKGSNQWDACGVDSFRCCCTGNIIFL